MIQIQSRYYYCFFKPTSNKPYKIYIIMHNIIQYYKNYETNEKNKVTDPVKVNSYKSFIYKNKQVNYIFKYNFYVGEAT